MSTRRTNVLLLFSDQHRYDWIGCAGRVPVRTPNIDAIAARGMRFTQCRVNSPMCAPSRACLATGLRYHRAGVPDNVHDLDPSLPTFMKQLRNAGYKVAAVGKTDLHKKSRLLGLEGWTSRHGQLGFTDTIDMAGKRDGAMLVDWPRPAEPYGAYLKARGLGQIVADDIERRRVKEYDRQAGIDAAPFPLAREHQMDDFCGRMALRMLDRLPHGEPWFLQVNLASPHPWFDAAADLLARYGDVDFAPPIDAGDGPNDHALIRRQYAALIEGMDDWIGWIIDRVSQRGELDNTLIVYSSDHGEMLGDHGRWNKGWPEDPSVRVPLVACGPGVPAGVVNDAQIELIDLAATFVELSGAAPIPACDARSFLPVLRGERDTHRDVAISAFGSWRLCTDGRLKLVEQREAPHRLYDLAMDPHEQHDIAGDAPAETARLAELLATELAS